jgi:hypothetical protein
MHIEGLAGGRHWAGYRTIGALHNYMCVHMREPLLPPLYPAGQHLVIHARCVGTRKPVAEFRELISGRARQPEVTRRQTERYKDEPNHLSPAVF